MKKILVVAGCLLFSAVFSLNHCMAADWQFPVGISYISGFSEVVDLYEENLEAEGYIVDTVWEVPVGLSFQPYVQLENGVRIGCGLGPLSYLISDSSYLDVPVNFNAGYTFFPEADTSPYVRLGVSYHLASGEYVESSSPGIFGGLGVDFKRNSPVGFGIDFSCDYSEVEFIRHEAYGYYWWNYDEAKENIKPSEYMLTFFVRF